MQQYAAKLLLQYRVEKNGRSSKLRICEERIVLLEARSADAAFQKAMRAGKAGQHRYKNSTGGVVYVEFVGVLDLLDRSICAPEEVWYEMADRVAPMERRKAIIPKKAELCAIRNEKNRTRPIGCTRRTLEIEPLCLGRRDPRTGRRIEKK